MVMLAPATWEVIVPPIEIPGVSPTGTGPDAPSPIRFRYEESPEFQYLTTSPVPRQRKHPVDEEFGLPETILVKVLVPVHDCVSSNPPRVKVASGAVMILAPVAVPVSLKLFVAAAPKNRLPQG